MVCESHHSNEDVPECTIRAAFDGLDDVLDVIAESCAEILDAGNRAELDQVQQDIKRCSRTTTDTALFEYCARISC